MGDKMAMLSFKHNFAPKIDVAGTGFAVLDRIYSDGTLTDEALGGSCGNVLISLAMLKRTVAPVLVLGNDEEGNQLVNEFTQAGAIVSYISRRNDLRSPILTQEINTLSGQHYFSFICPETQEPLPRYQPIGRDIVTDALPAFSACNVFYVDRLSENVVEAMQTAFYAGAIVYFEPSEIKEEELFEEALQYTSILKYSVDRLGTRLTGRRFPCIQIITHGASGLRLLDEFDDVWCDPMQAFSVVDTCGAGDMVSVGVIDWLLRSTPYLRPTRITHVLRGVVAGQHLAAENCSYTGARGLFKHKGVGYAMEILRKGYSAAETS